MIHPTPRVVAVIPDVVTNAIEAANAHRVDAFARCFSRGGVLNAWGMLFEGRDGIREWTEKWVVDYGVRFTDALHLWDGSTLALHTQIRGLGYNGPATLTFTLSDAGIEILEIE